MTPAQMAQLHAASFPRGWSEAEIAALLGKPTTLTVDTHAGFAILQVVAPEAEILTIAVDPSLRRQGLGRALLDQALLAAHARGVSEVFLEVDALNTAAISMYRAANFTEAGKRADYYAHDDGTRSDAILLSLALQAGR